MKRRLVLLLFINVFFSLRVLPQKQGDKLVDSLLQELAKTKEDTSRVKFLNDVSFAYSGINPGEGIKYAQAALGLATKTGWENGIAKANNNLAVNYISKSDYVKAMEYCEKGLKIYEKNGNKKGIAEIDGNIGVIYIYQGADPKALEYLMKAQAISEEIGDKKGISNALGDIGTIYDSQSEFAKALGYYSKELKMDEEIGDIRAIATDFGNMGADFTNLKDYATAIDYIQKSLKIALEIGNKYIAGADLFYVGSNYLAIAKDTAPPMPAAKDYVAGITMPLSKKALLQNAIDYLERGKITCKEGGDLELTKSCYEGLAEAYRLTGDYKHALENSDNFRAINDSVFTAANRIKITDIEARHEMELKEKQVEIDKLEIQKKHTERWFFTATIFLLAAISVLYINRQRLKQKKLAGEKENAESELAMATKLLDNFRQSVQEKNSIIEHFTAEIANLKLVETSQVNEDTLLQLERSIILTDQQWESFRVLFEKVHKGFLNRVKTKLPDLTPGELRFVALSKLKLSPKEMASMLGISASTIRNYRLRLRRKLGLNEEANIEDIADAI